MVIYQVYLRNVEDYSLVNGTLGQVSGGDANSPTTITVVSLADLPFGALVMMDAVAL